MALSTTGFSLNLPTFSTSKACNFQTRARIFNCRSNGKSKLSSSLWSLKICVNKTVSVKPMSARIGRIGCSASSSVLPSALPFDCDGVLVDIEKKELGITWDVDLCGELQNWRWKTRMTAYFNKTGWPEKAPSSEEERKVSAIVSCLLGPERADKIQIVAGDVVPRKKPDPAIYVLAANTLDVDPSSCGVVEDSAIGLAAAKAAGMTCIVTKSGYTANEDFLNADAVFDCIGNPPDEHFDLAFLWSLLHKQYVS